MKPRLIFFIYLTTLLLTACVKKDNSEFTDTPIVESYLRPGEYINLKVSRQIPFSSGITYSDDDLNSLRITVTNNGNSYILNSLGDGRYSTNSLIVKAGERYDLSFTYNSKLVSAYTQVPLKPVSFKESVTSVSVTRMDSTMGPPSSGGFNIPEPVVLTWNNDDESYYIVVIENMEATLDPIRDFGDKEMPMGRFRKAPTTSSGLTMRSQEFQYFGHHRIILYHVLPDYASLYKDNTASSQNLTNPSTSITNGYGIFTGLNADTLYINVEEAR